MRYHEKVMDLDLYSLLRQYALKNSSYEIPFTAFVDSVQRMARAHSTKSGELAAYDGEGSEQRIAAKLYVVAASRRISIQATEKGIQSILLPERFVEPLRAEYKKMDESPDIPFPGDDILSAPLPTEWIKNVSLERDLEAAIGKADPTDPPICRLSFASGLAPMLVLSDMLKEEILVQAVVKVRHYLRKGANFEFTRRKLLAAFQNKEMMLKDALNLVLTRPFDAVERLKSSRGDIVYSFWAYLLSHMRQDLLKRGERTPEDMTLLQAAAIVEFFNNHYKGVVQKNLDSETAFRNFDQRLRKAPYAYTYEDMCGFSDSSGKPFMGKYSKAEFDEYLRSKTHPGDLQKLPEIIVFQSLMGNRYYIAKERVLIMANKMLADARLEVRTGLIESWYKILGDYRRIPAMEDDQAYREELMSRLRKCAPLLVTMMDEKLILLVYFEIRGTKDALPELDRLFTKDELVPVDELLSLPRKSVLTDARILLPFWYSLGVVVSMMRFFRSMRRGKAQTVKEEAKRAEATAVQAGGDRQNELKDAALRVEKSVVPPNVSLDDYLVDLESKWNTLINLESKRDLTEDVNSLIRDYLRGVIRTMRGSTFSLERLQSLAETLIGSPALLRIKNTGALRSYVIAYMIRLVKKAS
jgi:hypothetical protein